MVIFEKGVEEVYSAITDGIRRFFTACGAKKAVLGLSGGLDSALVLALAADTIGSDNIRVMLMPSEYSTVHSVTDAVEMAEGLNVKYDIVEIHSVFKEFSKSLSPVFKGTKPDVTEENLQARIRGTLLMAASNKFGSLLLNTSNKSELAVGYGTLYGDLCGAVSVIGDIYKTQAYGLAEYINSIKPVIPSNIITKAPSAELRHGQKDSDSLPDYELLDSILFNLIEKGMTTEELVANGADELLVSKVVHLTSRNKFKALQCPPVIKVSSKPLLSAEKWI